MVIFHQEFRRLSNYSRNFSRRRVYTGLEKAELAKFGQAEIDSYEKSLKIYRDLKGVIDTAFDEGKIEGKMEVAKVLKESGVPTDIISKSTGLLKKTLINYSAYQHVVNYK